MVELEPGEAFEFAASAEDQRRLEDEMIVGELKYVVNHMDRQLASITAARQSLLVCISKLEKRA